MEKVPQIVSQRLKAVPSAVDHPDPDVLTAFSERLLLKSERAAVVEHLARCGECREILALALPAFEPAEETVRPASSGWLTWPVLRWGFIAAGIVAIASFGVMQYQRRFSMMADQTARPEAITKEAKNLPLAVPPTIPAEDRDKTPVAPASIPAEQEKQSSAKSSPNPSALMTTPASGSPARSKGAVRGGMLSHGPRVQWQQNTNLQQQAAQSVLAKQLPSAPAQESGAPSGSRETVDVESTLSANMDSSAVQNKIDQQALQYGRADGRVERTKPATTLANASNSTAPVFPPPAPSAKAQLIRESAQPASTSSAPTRWTVSAAGRLQRSLDQGATWQDVDVNNPSAATGSSLDVMRAPSKRKEVAADSLAKKDASAPLTFRAVSSNGPDVWAGASGGFLYHSTDAGGHWTHVVPSASGVTLTGDIVSLEFADSQHGRVVTSNPEVWTTSDAGQSWQKQ